MQRKVASKICAFNSLSGFLEAKVSYLPYSLFVSTVPVPRLPDLVVSVPVSISFV
jgi:hypothetical protein